MREHDRTIINVICSVTTLLLNLVIGFFLSPYIVENIGVEANGYVVLANNCVIYAQLIVYALNSMAARYITICYVQKDYTKAKTYYNSVFWGNLIIVAVLLLPAVIIISCLEYFFVVPEDILLDVKVLFSAVFLNFFLGTGLPNWDCGIYATNRLDRMYVAQMIATLARCVFLCAFFAIFEPGVWIVGVASVGACLIHLGMNAYNAHTLTPELKITLKRGQIICSWDAMKELVGAGIWHSVSNVGILLLSGLDLLICNIMIGPTAMGIVSVAKVLPDCLSQLSVAVRDAFAPELTINYAKGDRDAVLKDIKRAMKITSLIITIPLAGIVAFGDCFFSLWMPSQDARLLHTLVIIGVLGYAFTSGIQILYNVFATVNKVKENSIAVLLSGVISLVLTMGLVFFTEYDIYAVVGVNVLVNLVRNMIFTIPATAKYLGFKAISFYQQVGSSIFTVLVLVALGKIITFALQIKTWGHFILSSIFLSIFGIILHWFIILKKEERKYYISIIKSRIKTMRRM